MKRWVRTSTGHWVIKQRLHDHAR